MRLSMSQSADGQRQAGKEKIRKSESRKYKQINEHRKDTKEEKK